MHQLSEDLHGLREGCDAVAENCGKSWFDTYCPGVDWCTADLSIHYLIALYWAVTTLTTMGYGDITPNTPSEYIYTIFTMLIGVSFYAYIASNVSIVLSNIDEVGSEYRNNMEKLREFMIRKKLTLPLRRRLRKYFNVHWKSKGRVGIYTDVELVNVINLPVSAEQCSVVQDGLEQRSRV
jgi:hypothetical protein